MSQHICQLCQKEMSPLSLGRHLVREHNMSVEDYYLFINGMASTPLCPVCSSPLPFVKFSRGYAKYCSKSCASSATISRFNQDEGFQKLAAEGHRKRLQQDKEYQERKRKVARENLKEVNKDYTKFITPYQLFLRQTASNKSKLYNQDVKAGRNERYVYLIKGRNFVKIGTCHENNLEHRLSDLEAELGESIVPLYVMRASFTKALDLEEKVKIKFYDYQVPGAKHPTETFELSQKNQILNFIQGEVR